MSKKELIMYKIHLVPLTINIMKTNIYCFFNIYLASEVSPQWGIKLRIASQSRMWYIYMYVPHVHYLESVRKILWTQPK